MENINTSIRWFKNGDHPDDEIENINATDGLFLTTTEGKVVKYFNRKDVDPSNICPLCKKAYSEHGQIENVFDGDSIDGFPSYKGMVCPGDWVTTLDNGLYAITSDENMKPASSLFSPLMPIIE